MNPFIMDRDLLDLETLMMLRGIKGKAVEAEAAGNPLMFTTDVSKPLKSLLIPFTPQQSGTGDPSPQNIRPIVPWEGLKVQQAGKNLFDKTNGAEGFVWWEGQLAIGYNDFFASNKIPVVPGAKYTLKKDVTGQNQSELFDVNGNFVSQSTNMTGLSVSTFIIPDGVYFIAFNINKTALDTAQLEVGQTATAYEPYEHITETDIVFPAHGKNLLPESAVEYGSYGTDGGKIQDDNNKYRRLSIDLPAGNYVFSTDTPNCYFIRLMIDDVVSGTGGAINNKAFTLANPANVKMAWRNADTTAITETLHNQIETGSTPTAYEPFTNSVYGGTLDIVSGVLTVEWYGIVKKWSEGTNESTASGYTRKSFAFPVPVRGVNGQYFVQQKCNIAKLELSVDRKTHFYIDDSIAYLWLPEDTDVDEEIQLVSKLATPQEITLTPEQITALKGENTIWSDADGSMTAVYLKKG